VPQADVVIKRGDTLPTVTATLRDAAGTAVDLSAVASVRFRLAPIGGQPTVDAPALVIDAPNGVVQYTWAETDTATPGYYAAEFEAVWPNGDRLTFPNDRHLVVLITPDLG
jgi:hypothetical protein